MRSKIFSISRSKISSSVYTLLWTRSGSTSAVRSIVVIVRSRRFGRAKARRRTSLGRRRAHCLSMLPRTRRRLAGTEVAQCRAMETPPGADVRLRAAEPRDVPAIVGLIRGLAEFEKLTHLLEVTPEKLAPHLFGPKPVVE